MTADISIPDQQVEADISNILRWTYLSNDIGKVVFEKLIVIQPILVTVRSAAAELMGSRVRISLKDWFFVSC
jgi:hypothetical protein